MKVFFNEDLIHFLWTRYESNIDVDEKKLRAFIRKYENSAITDFAININGTTSSSLSEILETFTDKYIKTTEESYPVDFKNTYARLHHKIFIEKGLDMYEIWIDELKKIGINPWLSFRMNDCHQNMEEKPSVLRSEFVNNHPELWIAGNRRAAGYFDKCLNYLKPAVQERMLAYIEEQLNKYDVYGIELDFMREAYCFPEGFEEQGRNAIISFMEKVKSLADKIGKSRNKKIKISLTCQANPINAYNCGFDISELSQKGLVDLVVAGPRWDSINTDIPVGIWKKLLKDKTELGCIQQLLIAPHMNYKRTMSTLDMALGQVTAFKDLGADIIYLYNYFDTVESGLNDCLHSTAIRTQDNINYFLKNVGKIENSEFFDRRYPLTFDDSVPLFENINSRLPLTVDSGEFKLLRIVTGKIKKGQKSYLNIAFSTAVNPAELEIYCNNSPAVLCKESLADENIVAENTYTFEITPWQENSVVIAVNSKTRCTVNYAEILIKKV